MSFQNKTVWITGASSGIGKGLALAFSNQDANIIISARNEVKLKEVKAACKDPKKVRILSLDLTDFSSFEEKTKTAFNYFNEIDILVNNGGISQRSYAVDTEVNYFGTIALTKAILPYFISKKDGQIVVISSIMGKLGTPLRSAYAGSKHALHGFFDSLRAELYQDNIKVTIICPGYVNTDVSKNALTADGSKFEELDEATANGLSPEEFANKALKVISKQKREVIIAGVKEKAGVYLKRFFPSVLANVIRKVNVT